MPFGLCVSANSEQQKPRTNRGEPVARPQDQSKGEKGGPSQSEGWFVNEEDIKRITREMKNMDLGDHVSIFCEVLVDKLSD